MKNLSFFLLYLLHFSSVKQYQKALQLSKQLKYQYTKIIIQWTNKTKIRTLTDEVSSLRSVGPPLRLQEVKQNRFFSPLLLLQNESADGSCWDGTDVSIIWKGLGQSQLTSHCLLVQDVTCQGPARQFYFVSREETLDSDLTLLQ